MVLGAVGAVSARWRSSSGGAATAVRGASVSSRQDALLGCSQFRSRPVPSATLSRSSSTCRMVLPWSGAATGVNGQTGVGRTSPWEREVITTSDAQELTVAVEGLLASEGRLALSELARIGGEFQASVERVGAVLVGLGETRPGRRPGDVVEATRLALVGFHQGSAVLAIEPQEQQGTLAPSLLDESLEAFLNGIEALADDPETLPRGFDRGVVNGLRELTGGLGRAVTAIRIQQSGRAPVVLDQRVKQAVRTYLRQGIAEDLVVTGRLNMGDFAPSALRCRIDTPSESIPCDFDVDLRHEILGAMDQIVTAQGQAERWRDSRTLKVLHLESVESVPDAERRTIDDLVAEQGISPLSDASELVGERMDDFDAFLDAVRSLRSA